MTKFKLPIALLLIGFLLCLFFVGCYDDNSNQDGIDETPAIGFEVSLYKGKYDVSFSFPFSTVEITETQVFVDDIACDFLIFEEKIFVSLPNFVLEIFVLDGDLVCKLTDTSMGFWSIAICYPFFEEDDDPFLPDPDDEPTDPDIDDIEPDPNEQPDEPSKNPQAETFVGIWIADEYNLEIFFDQQLLYANFCGALAVFVIDAEQSTFSINQNSKQTTYTVFVLDEKNLKVVWDEFDFDLFRFFTIELVFTRQ